MHDGLENTLIILSFISLRCRGGREYDRSLPRISAHGSELNPRVDQTLD